MKKNGFRSISALFAVVILTAFAAIPANADLKVNVMPSGVASPVNTWDSKPYTWPGNNLELWGNVFYTGSGTLTYTWNFGAGEGSAAGTVSNRNNISAYHIYAGGGSYVATLTVTDGVETDSDTVYIDVVPTSDAVKTNLAIQRGLKYLYVNRSSTVLNGCTAYHWGTTYSHTLGPVGLAVLAFEDHGHRESNDPTKDIYAETVKYGLNYIFANLAGTATGNTPNTYSDINGNGRMVYSSNLYDHSLFAMAIANTASASPSTVVSSCGSTEVRTKTYKTVLEDMVDFIAYAQEHRSIYSGYGGWRYTANYTTSDNSVSQWPVLALAAAEGAPWNIASPAWIKTMLPSWINRSQNGNGGFGYDSATSWLNVAKTGAGIIEMVYAGSGGNMNNALNFLSTNWNCCSATSNYGNIGDHYAMYAVKKGLQYAGYATIGGHDWQKEYNQWYVANQINAGTNGGYWNGVMYVDSRNGGTAMGLLVMAPGLVELPPVANAGPDQEIPANQNVSFNGSASYHSDPARHIVTYEWDFDYNGVAFDVDATGVAVTRVGGYTLPGGVESKNYSIALRVTDDNSPVRTSIDTLVVKVTNGNVAPVANAGGPYLGAVGANITLNGTGSYDANSASGTNPICGQPTSTGCDEIVKYEWDLDGDGQFDDALGATPSVNFGSFMGTKTVGLKVTDSFGRSATQSSALTTVAISNLKPLCYVNTLNSYNRLTGRWTVGWKLKLINEGTGAASSVKAKMTGTSIPAGVTILDDNMSWSGSIDPAEAQLSDDDFRYNYSRSSTGPDLSTITWDIELLDALGVTHVIRNIPQGSGTCQ